MSSPGENKIIARRFLEEIFNERNFSLVDELVSDKSTDAAQESWIMYLVLSAFPDFRLNIERMVAEGDRVAVLSTFGGTHTADFMGIAPTRKGVLGRKIDIFTISDEGKITNILYNFDILNLMTQLGAFPSTAVYEPRGEKHAARGAGV